MTSDNKGISLDDAILLSATLSAKGSGVKHDESKPDMSLIPALAETEEAKVWTFGKRKYSAFNWANGFDFNRIIAALHRHLNAIKRGEDVDPESGLLHAAHIRCCAAMLIQFTVEKRTELDDRYKGGKP